MKRVMIIAHTERKPEIVPVMRDLVPWIRTVANVGRVVTSLKSDLSKAKADLILTFGGDGTILSVARRLKGNPIPVLGVNMGQMGFLAEVDHTELQKVLPQVLDGDYELSPRMMLRARAEKQTKRGKAREFVALNDAIILRQPKGALTTMSVTVSGESVAQYQGDGLIVSTPTGSTGYSLSAGGPILSERLKALAIVPICAHTLASRPIVLSGDEVVEVRPVTRSGMPVELLMDGQASCSMKSGSRVTIEKAPYEFHLATLGRKGRYEIIRDKLHWAGWVKER